MFSTSFLPLISLSLLAVARAAPLASRAGQDPPPRSVENINAADLSTPVFLEHIFNGDFLDGVPQIFDGNITVLGLTLDSRQDGVAKQIACLNDPHPSTAGNSTDDCLVKQHFCEVENDSFFAQQLNTDEPASAPVNDCSADKDGKTPIACIPDDDPDFSPSPFFVNTTESPFEIDNDQGHTLSVTKKGPIGVGFTTSVEDNGNSTFTVAGNLTTFSKALALQMGCLFDEAACNSDSKGKDCTAQRLKCQADNKLNSRTVILSQTTDFPDRLPDGVTSDSPVDIDNPIFRRGINKPLSRSILSQVTDSPTKLPGGVIVDPSFDPSSFNFRRWF